MRVQWCAVTSHIDLGLRDVVHHHAGPFLHVGYGHLTLVFAVVLHYNLRLLNGSLSWVFGTTAPFSGFWFGGRSEDHGGCLVVTARTILGVGCAVRRGVVSAAAIGICGCSVRV